MKQKEFDTLLQASKWNQQTQAEIIAGFEHALAIVISAAMRQLDATKFAEQLRAQIAASKLVDGPTWLVERVATHVLAAAEAESAHQNPSKH